MKKSVFLGIVILAIFCSACALPPPPSSNIANEDFLDFEPSRQILQFQDMRDGYYMQFAKKPDTTEEWCKDTVVEQKQLIVGGNPVSRVCLEADNRYYLD